MTTAVTSMIATSHRFAGSGRHLFGAMVQPIVKWWKLNRDIEHLQEMPDSMLKDMGLQRWQIPIVVRSGTLDGKHD